MPPTDPFERAFTLGPMGTSKFHQELYETSIGAASRLEPVGIWLRRGDVFFVTLSGGVHVEAQVGMRGDGPYQRFRLDNGINQVVATEEGPLFLSNESTHNTARAVVYSSGDYLRIPTFRLGESNDAEFLAEVRAATDVPKIFLIGKYFMTYADRENYLGTNTKTGTTPIILSPTAYLNKRDRDLRMYHEFVGKNDTVNSSAANSFQVSREFISTSGTGYMDAKDAFINIERSPGLMARLFDQDERPSGKGAAWSSGPWHELGHHQQQYLMTFNNAGEAAPNIYKGLLNLHSGNGYGFGIGEDFPPSKLYARKDAPADATGAPGHYMEYMYLQLYAAFGEGFYSNLHHEYRLIDNATAASLNRTWGEMPLFAYLTSKVSGRDLTPFFASWKLPISEEYARQIAALELPTPSTDLSTRVITEIKSPADLEGRYEVKVEPYTNLPVAKAKSDFIVRYGTDLSPYDLITYDRNVVKKAEFLNPNQKPTEVALSGKTYGLTMIEILLTGYDGQQNVVVATGMIKPRWWAASAGSVSAYYQVLNYVNSTLDDDEAFDVAEAQLYLEMIHGIQYPKTAALVKRLEDAIVAKKRAVHGTPLHDAYYHSISDADTFLYQREPDAGSNETGSNETGSNETGSNETGPSSSPPGDSTPESSIPDTESGGLPALRIDAIQWRDMISSGQLVIRAYETGSNRFLGHVRDGSKYPDRRSLNIVSVDDNGSDVVVYIDQEFGSTISLTDGGSATIQGVRFEVFHRNVDNAWQEIDVHIDPTRIGATDTISARWVEDRFRRDMTYFDDGNTDPPTPSTSSTTTTTTDPDGPGPGSSTAPSTDPGGPSSAPTTDPGGSSTDPSSAPSTDPGGPGTGPTTDPGSTEPPSTPAPTPDPDPGVVWSLPENAWNAMMAAGSIYLEAYRNGERTGWTDGHSDNNMPFTITDGVVTIRTPTPAVEAGDVYTLRGKFTSNTAPDLSGSFQMRLTANMLSSDLPVQVS